MPKGLGRRAEIGGIFRKRRRHCNSHPAFTAEELALLLRVAESSADALPRLFGSMLKPFLYIALIFRLMASMQEYGIIFALTKGGPGDTLMNLSLTAYNKGFAFLKFGEAMPYILFLWVIIYIISKKLVSNWLLVQKKASGR